MAADSDSAAAKAIGDEPGARAPRRLLARAARVAIARAYTRAGTSAGKWS